MLGNFSAIIVSYGFKRRIGYYIIQVYAPDIFIVMLSWIVFWMDKDDMGNRMALGITTILTIMFLLGATNGSMPKVSYAKALDWYLLISFVFVFLSLVECMIVFLISPKKKPARKKTDMDKVNFWDMYKIVFERVYVGSRSTRGDCKTRGGRYFMLAHYGVSIG